jgi:hypothetical protein
MEIENFQKTEILSIHMLHLIRIYQFLVLRFLNLIPLKLNHVGRVTERTCGRSLTQWESWLNLEPTFPFPSPSRPPPSRLRRARLAAAGRVRGPGLSVVRSLSS